MKEANEKTPFVKHSGKSTNIFYVTKIINSSKWRLYEFYKFIIPYYCGIYFRLISSRDLQLFIENLKTKE